MFAPLRLIPLVTLTLFVSAGRAQPLGPLGPLDENRAVSYFIAPPSADADARPADAELALWSLEAWQRAAGGTLSFVRAATEEEALVRLYWVPASGGQYGEMRSFFDVRGRRGAAVFIRPDTAALGEEIATRARLDALFRDTIVYLTCLHELGHALGLGHTAEFEDVMYFFGFGGDITEFFERYRRTLHGRDDIRRSAGLSRGDRQQLVGLYGAPQRTANIAAAN